MSTPEKEKLLSELEEFSGHVILVHGFNVKDGGKGTTDGLRSHFEDEGFEVLEFDTGWRFLAGVRWGNAKRARRLARMIKPGDILVGHSDGCNLINLASWHLSGSAEKKPATVVYLNPALDRDTQLAPQILGALVFSTMSDRVVQLASWLSFHPWGDMGRVGYSEGSAFNDSRYVNVTYEHLGIMKPGHSGALKKTCYRKKVLARIQIFLQSYQND